MFSEFLKFTDGVDVSVYTKLNYLRRFWINFKSYEKSYVHFSQKHVKCDVQF